MTPTPYILPVELIYRALASPKTPDAIPARVKEAPAIELTRADVDAIVQSKRSATPEELQTIISRAKDFDLTDGERNQLGVALSVAMAQRARGVNGRREDVNSKFIHDLGFALTPFGLLHERAWFQNELQAGTKAIAACRRHLPPQCSCWREAREDLYNIRASFGERSPESWAALKVWEALEEIELSSRPGA